LFTQLVGQAEFLVQIHRLVAEILRRSVASQGLDQAGLIAGYTAQWLHVVLGQLVRPLQAVNQILDGAYAVQSPLRTDLGGEHLLQILHVLPAPIDGDLLEDVVAPVSASRHRDSLVKRDGIYSDAKWANQSQFYI